MLKLNLVLLSAILLAAPGHTVPLAYACKAAGVLSVAVSAIIDLTLKREKLVLEQNYTRTDMVVTGYDIREEPCFVCIPYGPSLGCVNTGFKALVKNEFYCSVDGATTTQRVISGEHCGTDALDAHRMAARLSPVGTRTPIWYRNSNTSDWISASERNALSYLSKAFYVLGAASIVAGYNARLR